MISRAGFHLAALLGSVFVFGCGPADDTGDTSNPTHSQTGSVDSTSNQTQESSSVAATSGSQTDVATHETSDGLSSTSSNATTSDATDSSSSDEGTSSMQWPTDESSEEVCNDICDPNIQLRATSSELSPTVMKIALELVVQGDGSLCNGSCDCTCGPRGTPISMRSGLQRDLSALAWQPYAEMFEFECPSHDETQASGMVYIEIKTDVGDLGSAQADISC